LWLATPTKLNLHCSAYLILGSAPVWSLLLARNADWSSKMTEIITSQTPPILHGPSEKERKYDRQLRLWAASGQAALESANILLLNSGCGTVGVETIKNLVLPGKLAY